MYLGQRKSAGLGVRQLGPRLDGLTAARGNLGPGHGEPSREPPLGAGRSFHSILLIVVVFVVLVVSIQKFLNFGKRRPSGFGLADDGAGEGRTKVSCGCVRH